jgi:hypothetical protein
MILRVNRRLATYTFYKIALMVQEVGLLSCLMLSRSCKIYVRTAWYESSEKDDLEIEVKQKDCNQS